MTHVVDTSVVLKWVVAEEDSDLALTWVGTPLAAPDLIEAELANALWKKVRGEEIEPEQAMRALGETSGALALMPAAPLAERALAMALELSHPVYDCFFLALASNLEVQILTADKRLVRACAGTRYRQLVRPLQEVD